MRMDLESVLNRMDTVDGWFAREEGALLFRMAEQALQGGRVGTLVEIGSYCGRSTVVLGSAVLAYRPSAKVHAIDPHEGMLSTPEGTAAGLPSFERFNRNIDAAGLREVIVTVSQRSDDVPWSLPIALLLIDGLHDYNSVRRDFHHFGPWVEPGGFIAFHDFRNAGFTGVERCVNEILALPAYGDVALVGSLKVIQKRGV